MPPRPRPAAKAWCLVCCAPHAPCKRAKGTAPTSRRPKGIQEPKTPPGVPGWLTKAYGIQFVDGQPDIPGWDVAYARAASILKDPAFAWLEHLRNLEADLAAASTATKRSAIKPRIRKARRALRNGTRFPRVETLALAEFLITLDIWHPRTREEGSAQKRTSLPFVVLCALAWWQGLLRQEPFDPDVQDEIQEMMKRHWSAR